MIPELGHIALIVALLLAVCASVLPLLASWKPAYNAQLGYMRPFSLLFLFLVSVSMACLFWSLIYNDFSVSYVANHSNTQLPLRYRIAALWADTKARYCCGYGYLGFGLRRWPYLASVCPSICAPKSCR